MKGTDTFGILDWDTSNLKAGTKKLYWGRNVNVEVAKKGNNIPRKKMWQNPLS